VHLVRLTAVARGPTDGDDASSLSAGIWAAAEDRSLGHVFTKPDGHTVEIVLFIVSSTRRNADRMARSLCESAILGSTRFAQWRIEP
jgi:hypothetical protein